MIASNEMKTRWTIADLESLPDNGDRYEIIAGELYVTHVPHWRHQSVITHLLFQLSKSLMLKEKGVSLSAPGVIFSNEDTVIPDVVWISHEKIESYVNEWGHFTTAPEFMAEVLTQDTQYHFRDRQVKLDLYSRVGVQEYWIIDWRQQTVEIYRRSPDHLALEITLFGEDELTSSLFADFKLKVADLF